MKFVLKSTLIAITIFVILSLATSRSASKSKTKDVRTITGKTPKQTDGSGNVTELGKHDIKCPTGSALSYFKLERGGGKFHYKKNCLAHLAISNDSKVQYTGYTSREDKGTNFLDRQKVKCPKGKVLSQFKLQTKKGKMRYQFTCTTADIGKCYDKVTSKTDGGKNYESYYLDRQNKIKVTNKNSQVFQGFKLQTKNFGWNPFSGRNYNVQYYYTIYYCDLNAAKEPAPKTPEQQAEDAKNLQAGIADHREREVRRRFK